jgi:hypothetical protein
MATSDYQAPQPPSPPPSPAWEEPARKRPPLITSLKVPLIIVCSVVSLGVGAAGGVGALLAMGYQRPAPPDASAQNAANAQQPGTGGPGGGRGPGGGMMGGAPGGGMMGGGAPGGGGRPGGGRGGPSPKAQLASLVTKLDQLSSKPLTIQLDADQKKKVQEQLKGLEDEDEMKDEDAKTRLDALLDLVKDQRDTLEAAGYRWPGEGGGFGGGGFGGGPGGGNPNANPFKDAKNHEHLTSLQAQVAK